MPACSSRSLSHLRDAGLERADLQPSRCACPASRGTFWSTRSACTTPRSPPRIWSKVDVDGNIIGHSDWPINPAGFTFHGAIHATQGRALRDPRAPRRRWPCAAARTALVHQFLRRPPVGQDRVSRLRRHHGASRRGAHAFSPAPVTSQCCCCATTAPVAIGQTLPMAFSYMWVLQRA